MGAKPSNLTILGIAKEPSFGTPATATAFIATTGAPTSKDEIKLVEDKGLRGAMVEVFGEVQTLKSSTVDFAGDVFPDTIGWVAVGVLGDLVSTGSGAPYTHSIAVYNSNDGQPPSYTLTDCYVVNTRQYPGAKFSELGIKFSADGLLTYTAKAMGLASIPTTVPTASYSSVPPVASWTGSVSIGGTAVQTVMDGDLTIKRNVTVVGTVDGSQSPHALWSGPVGASGKFTLVMEDETQLVNYLTNTQPSLDINFTSGTGAALTQVRFHMSQVAYTVADIGRGKDYVELAVSYTAIANATDIGASAGYSPIKMTLQNAIAAGTYK